MPSEPTPQRRRVVLHPRTAASRQLDRARSFGGFVRGFTVDTDDVIGLMAAQRRAALRTFAIVFGPLLALPVFFALAPDAATVRWGPLPPLAWVLLGPVALGSIVVASAANAFAAERREDAWLDTQEDRAR